MNRLQYRVLQLCKEHRDGSHSTQANRQRILLLAVAHLDELGEKTNKMKLSHLSPRHVKMLVDKWQADGIATATIKNRMSALRWLGDKLGKADFVGGDNASYGIERRRYTTNQNKSEQVSHEQLAKLPPDMALSVRLQSAFGLRREESLKFQPTYALKGWTPETAEKIHIKPTWAKGGRYREIAVTTPEQRQLLAEVIAYCRTNHQQSMTPAQKSYVQHMKLYEYHTNAVGVGHTHGLRHHFAHTRYAQITGFQCPAVGGVRVLTDEQKALDIKAREIITQELGHGRLEVTNIYLGVWRNL